MRRSVGASQGGRRMETVWKDLGYGARSLMRSPGFTAAAVLSLALGIGTNTAIFTLIDSVLLRTLPVERPDELVLLAAHGQGVPPDYRFSFNMFHALRQRAGELVD